MQKLCEPIGALTGLVGTGLLALAVVSPLWTFVLYGVSNVAWIGYAVSAKSRWLLLMNAGYACTTLMGLAHYWPG